MRVVRVSMEKENVFLISHFISFSIYKFLLRDHLFQLEGRKEGGGGGGEGDVSC